MEEDKESESASAKKPDDASGCFKLHTGIIAYKVYCSSKKFCVS